MNNLLFLIIVLFAVSACSLNKNSKFWTNSKKIETENTSNYEEIFPKEETLKKEFNSNLSIKLNSKINDSTNLNNLLNNEGRIKFDGLMKKSSRYKFSKVKNFHQYQPDITFYKNNIIFLITRVQFYNLVMSLN